MLTDMPTVEAGLDNFSVQVRDVVPTDLNYLTATWLKAYLSGSGLSGRMDHVEYYDLHRPVVTGLLERCKVLIAHPAGDPDTILGFVVTESVTVVHWLYVRNAWRGNGIARQLFKSAGLTDETLFTHWTETAAHLMRRFKGLVYYPYLVTRG